MSHLIYMYLFSLINQILFLIRITQTEKESAAGDRVDKQMRFI